MNFNSILRVAALGLCFSSGAHAASGGHDYNPLAPDPSAGATGATEAAPDKTVSAARSKLTSQLIRASWYGGGERLATHTSTGEVFRPMGHTAAHRTLPFGTMLKVTAASTGRSTIVRVNDRGPAAYTGRALDLSRGAALDLGIVAAGEGRVFIEVMR